MVRPCPRTKTPKRTRLQTVQSCRVLHDSLESRQEARPKTVHELILCPPNDRILERDGQLGLVWDGLDGKLGLCPDLS